MYRKIIFIYDDKGNIINEKVYLPDGSLDSECISEYDNKENKIAVSIYNSDDSLLIRDTDKFDDKGNKIEWKHFDCYNDLEREFKWLFNYDDKMNVIEKIVYNLNGGDYKIDYKNIYKYVYDSMGNWIKKTEFKKGSPQIITEREIKYYE